MEIQVINTDGQSSGNLTLADAIFDREFNEALVHQVVVAYLAGGRAGTRAQKSRSDVNGSGSKPWRQKGTGRARAGALRSPLWRGGGVTFAARPQDHSQKVNRKMYRGALRSILSELRRQERLIIVANLHLETLRTKQALQALANIGVASDEKVLLVTEHMEHNLELAVRNLHKVTVNTTAALAPTALVSNDKVVITQAALAQIEGWLS